MRIDRDLAEAALARDIGAPLGLSVTAAVQGVSEIVDETMAGAGRMHAVEAGKDLSTRVMIDFGGNGPLHATRVARRSGVRRIVIPCDPGVGSAVGFLHAPVSFEIVRSHYARLDALDLDSLNAILDAMASEAAEVVRLGHPDGSLIQRRRAFMRYHGLGQEIEIALPDRALEAADLGAVCDAFEIEYARQFNRMLPDMSVEILNWGLSVASQVQPPRPIETAPSAARPAAQDTREILCDVTGILRSADLFDRSALAPGDTINGSALIIEPQTTTLVSADFTARIDARGNIWLTRPEEPAP